MTLTILTNPRDLLYNPAMARYINYPGWCKSNFGLVVLPISYTLPSLLNTAINAALSRPLMTHLDMTMLLGMFGFLAGAAIHLPVNNYASKHGYGLTRGGKLVKAWQTAAYAVPVIGGLALSTAIEPATDKTDTTTQHAEQQTQTIPVYQQR